jgi:hypothetical protein
MEPIRTDGQSSLFEIKQMNASRARFMWSQVTKYFLKGTLRVQILCEPQ